MPMKTVVNRINVSDIASIIAPGFYLYFAVHIFYTAYYQFNGEHALASANSFWDILFHFSTSLYEKPSMLLFIFFASYLLGTVLRAIPVRFTESLIPPFHSRFPYPDALNNVLATLRANKTLIRYNEDFFPAQIEHVHMNVFNYWKNLLCLKALAVFHHYKSFENRSRFFAGMILSSLAATIASIIMNFVNQSCSSVYIPLFVLSGTLFTIFGVNFRRIRRQEAEALFTMYIAFLQEGQDVAEQ